MPPTSDADRANCPPPAPPLPACWRWLGPVLAAGFGAGVALRRAAYALGLRRPRRASIPVISVGNLTVGGTGKTPAVAYLARELVVRGLARKPAVVMRGYGAARPGEANDEARELARLCPGVPVIANPDRHAGAQVAAAQGSDVVLLDDGFQHWQLARDLDIVLLDATAPLHEEHLLPWGRLRERPVALARAHAVILTRADLVPVESLEQQRRYVAARAPDACICHACHVPTECRRLWSSAPPQPAASLAGRPVLACCGLGHPAAFFSTLAKLGAKAAASRVFPDHHLYTREEVRSLLDEAARAGAAGIVVTEKDAAKWETLTPPQTDLPVWALAVRFSVTQGEGELWERIHRVIERSGDLAK